MIAIHFTLTLREPVLATAAGSDPNTSDSLPYIPGSMIRGALASIYLEDTSYEDNAKAFQRLFLTGETRYFNAYPLSKEGAVTYPTPGTLVKEKENSSQIHDLAAEDEIEPQVKRIKKPFFIPAKGIGSLSTLEPEFVISVHTARKRESGRAEENEGAVFRYRALKEGQSFAGIVTVEDEADEETVRDLLDDALLLLGGSSTAGYGLTAVTVHEKAIWSALVSHNQLQDNQLTIYCASDLIVRHPETGQIGPYLQEWLTNALSSRLTPVKIFQQTDWVGGFNAEWGLPLPQTWAIQKGSVFIFQVEEAAANLMGKLAEIAAGGIGERLAEGFGQVVINPAWQLDSLVNVPQAAAAEPPKLDAASKKLLTQMNGRLAEQQLTPLMLVTAQNLVNGSRMQALSNSQLGRLRLRLRQELEQSGETLSGFSEYLKGTEKRKFVNDQFRKSRLSKGRNFRKWLQDMADNPNLVWSTLNVKKIGWEPKADGWQKQLLGDDPLQLDNTLTRRYAIQLMDTVCKNIAADRRKAS